MKKFVFVELIMWIIAGITAIAIGNIGIAHYVCAWAALILNIIVKLTKTE